MSSQKLLATLQITFVCCSRDVSEREARCKTMRFMSQGPELSAQQNGGERKGARPAVQSPAASPKPSHHAGHQSPRLLTLTHHCRDTTGSPDARYRSKFKAGPQTALAAASTAVNYPNASWRQCQLPLPLSESQSRYVKQDVKPSILHYHLCRLPPLHAPTFAAAPPAAAAGAAAPAAAAAPPGASPSTAT
jgi:hypothetical protein